MCVCMYIYIYIHMLPGPGPLHPPPPPVRWHPPRHPAAGPAQPEQTHTKQREGGRRRMIPASASSQSGEPHQSRDWGTIYMEQRAGNEQVAMTLLVTSGCKHTSVEHTAPHRRGGANRKTTGPPNGGGGGGDKAKQDQPGRQGKQQGQARRLPTSHASTNTSERYIYIYTHMYIYMYMYIWSRVPGCYPHPPPPPWYPPWPPRLRVQGLGSKSRAFRLCNVTQVIKVLGFWVPLYYNYNKEIRKVI